MQVYKWRFLLCIAAVFMLFICAFAWYPPLWQSSYTPAAQTAPYNAQQPDLLNVNTATAQELALLPGIGQVKAAAIVAWREENGTFSSPQQLLEVTGIGQGTLDRLLEYIYIA